MQCCSYFESTADTAGRKRFSFPLANSHLYFTLHIWLPISFHLKFQKRKIVVQSMQTLLRLRISWSSSTGWFQVIFHLETENWEQLLQFRKLPVNFLGLVFAQKILLPGGSPSCSVPKRKQAMKPRAGKIENSGWQKAIFFLVQNLGRTIWWTPCTLQAGDFPPPQLGVLTWGVLQNQLLPAHPGYWGNYLEEIQWTDTSSSPYQVKSPLQDMSLFAKEDNSKFQICLMVDCWCSLQRMTSRTSLALLANGTVLAGWVDDIYIGVRFGCLLIFLP